MTTDKQKTLKKIAEEITSKMETHQALSKEIIHEIKKKTCKKYHLQYVPSDADILENLPHLSKPDDRYIREILKKKPVRTISGVAIVAVMTSPASCPHGHCIICPGGPPNTAQSYTGKEPAALRATLNDYDPFSQTQGRIKQLETIGHPTDKIELIIMGGTFTARTPYYQQWFVKRCYDALNNNKCHTLKQAMHKNMTAKHRCIGLTIETRPDWLRIRHIDQILNFGATRVELGVQSTSDKILTNIERKHTVNDTIYATRTAKDAGLKICYHIMPGLPGNDLSSDLEEFTELFHDQRFRPDMIKIYPTLVIKGTQLYDLWKKRHYRPLETIPAIKLLSEMKKNVPPWVRIQRVERDIPANLIEAGVKKSNLRQLVKYSMAANGWLCRCIRCREVGHRTYKEGIVPEKIDMVKYSYKASDGEEIFISLEDKKNDLLIGYCRLRIPSMPHRPEFISDSGVIRELKIHGFMVPIGDKPQGDYQHKGYGENLINNVEKISESYGIKKLLVLSGIGVKKYYYNLGFKDDGLYVSKFL